MPTDIQQEFLQNILGLPSGETPEQTLLRALAREYVETTEAYDRTVCTGPIIRDEIMPRDSREGSLIRLHAVESLHTLLRLAREQFPHASLSDLQGAISGHRRNRRCTPC